MINFKLIGGCQNIDFRLLLIIVVFLISKFYWLGHLNFNGGV